MNSIVCLDWSALMIQWWRTHGMTFGYEPSSCQGHRQLGLQLFWFDRFNQSGRKTNNKKRASTRLSLDFSCMNSLQSLKCASDMLLKDFERASMFLQWAFMAACSKSFCTIHFPALVISRKCVNLMGLFLQLGPCILTNTKNKKCMSYELLESNVNLVWITESNQASVRSTWWTSTTACKMNWMNYISCHKLQSINLYGGHSSLVCGCTN